MAGGKRRSTSELIKRWVPAAYVVVLHLLIGFLLIYVIRIQIWTPIQLNNAVVPEIATSPLPTPSPDTSPCNAVDVTASPTPLSSLPPNLSENRSLIIPVAGVNADKLVDTFTASRSEGRSHDAIDIIAPQGTPVLAAVSGQITRFFDSVQGGITIYEMSEDGRLMYYYAHLQRRAEDIKPGDTVTQGKTIGFVGDTGNAGPGNYHLHFSIARVTDPKRWWQGEYVNPYPYLKAGQVPE